MKSRNNILEKLLKKIPVSQVDTMDLAMKTNGFVGSDLCLLVKEAAGAAVRRMLSLNKASKVFY